MPVHITLDDDEVVGDLADSTLIDEIKSRKLNFRGDVDFRDVESAYDYLRAGDAAEALLILERLVRPKWRTLAQAEAALAATVRS